MIYSDIVLVSNNLYIRVKKVYDDDSFIHIELLILYVVSISGDNDNLVNQPPELDDTKLGDG